MSRFPPIDPEDLTSDQRKTHDFIAKTAGEYFGPNGEKFTWASPTGALVGPFAPLIYVPHAVAVHFLGLATALSSIPHLPAAAREVAILATGAHFGAAYELYAHGRVAEESTDLTREQVDEIKGGKKPEGLDGACDVAYEMAKALLHGRGALDGQLWERAVKELGGKDGAQAVAQYVSLYAYTSILLNACDVPVPSEKAGKAEK